MTGSSAVLAFVLFNSAVSASFNPFSHREAPALLPRQDASATTDPADSIINDPKPTPLLVSLVGSGSNVVAVRPTGTGGLSPNGSHDSSWNASATFDAGNSSSPFGSSGLMGTGTAVPIIVSPSPNPTTNPDITPLVPSSVSSNSTQDSNTSGGWNTTAIIPNPGPTAPLPALPSDADNSSINSTTSTAGSKTTAVDSGIGPVTPLVPSQVSSVKSDTPSMNSTTTTDSQGLPIVVPIPMPGTKTPPGFNPTITPPAGLPTTTSDRASNVTAVDTVLTGLPVGAVLNTVSNTDNLTAGGGWLTTTKDDDDSQTVLPFFIPIPIPIGGLPKLPGPPGPPPGGIFPPMIIIKDFKIPHVKGLQLNLPKGSLPKLPGLPEPPECIKFLGIEITPCPPGPPPPYTPIDPNAPVPPGPPPPYVGPPAAPEAKPTNPAANPTPVPEPVPEKPSGTPTDGPGGPDPVPEKPSNTPSTTPSSTSECSAETATITSVQCATLSSGSTGSCTTIFEKKTSCSAKGSMTSTASCAAQTIIGTNSPSPITICCTSSIVENGKTVCPPFPTLTGIPEEPRGTELPAPANAESLWRVFTSYWWSANGGKNGTTPKTKNGTQDMTPGGSVPSPKNPNIPIIVPVTKGNGSVVATTPITPVLWTAKQTPNSTIVPSTTSSDKGPTRSTLTDIGNGSPKPTADKPIPLMPSQWISSDNSTTSTEPGPATTDKGETSKASATPTTASPDAQHSSPPYMYKSDSPCRLDVVESEMCIDGASGDNDLRIKAGIFDSYVNNIGYYPDTMANSSKPVNMTSKLEQALIISPAHKDDVINFVLLKTETKPEMKWNSSSGDASKLPFCKVMQDWNPAPGENVDNCVKGQQKRSRAVTCNFLCEYKGGEPSEGWDRKYMNPVA